MRPPQDRSGLFVWSLCCRLVAGSDHFLFVVMVNPRLVHLLTFLQSSKNSLQFPAERNTSGNKTPPTSVPFHTNYDYRSRLYINKDLFLCDSLHNTTL